MSWSLSTSGALTGLHAFSPLSLRTAAASDAWVTTQAEQKDQVPQTGFKTKIWLQAWPRCLLFCFHVGLGFTQPLLGFGPGATFETTFSICCGEEEKRFP